MFITACSDAPSTHPRTLEPLALAARYYGEEANCTDEWCADQPDDWGDSGWGTGGGDSWDSFGENGSDGLAGPITLYADGHDDTAKCVVGYNCTLRDATSEEVAAIAAEINRLLHMPQPFCQQLGIAAKEWNDNRIIRFFDNSIPARNWEGKSGFLGGDIHYPDRPEDPYSNQMHIFGGRRSMEERLNTFRHESASLSK
jgi:hypothetical protein